MTPFLAGALFGGLLVAGVFAIVITRFQRPREIEEWDDPFVDPPPLKIKTTISKRQYYL